MRSLDTSLPKSSTRRKSKMSSSDLHQAFKTAAQSVARLYMTATSDNENNRAAGYQEAIEDLLEFLDQENLGLQDGEGWRVRRWATERHSPTLLGSESDDDGQKDDDIAQDSPETTSRQLEPTRNAQEDSSMVISPTVQQDSASVSSFPLQSLPSRDVASDRDYQSAPPTPGIQAEATPAQSFTFESVPIQLDFQPRSKSRQTSTRQKKSRPRETTPVDIFGVLGVGAGSKRKAPFSEFFDVNASWLPRDGNKRGRLG